MVLIRYHQYKSYWIIAILAGFSFLLIPYTEAWSQGRGSKVEDTRQRSVAKGLPIIVQEGRLFLDVQDADLAEVLAQIGRQAGIRMSSGPSSGKRVSAQFVGVELEEGLRRLLRMVSLSHMFLYAQGPAGKVTISELRVLGEGKESTPGPATVTVPGLPENAQNTGTVVPKARRQSRTGAAGPEGSAGSEAIQSVPEVVVPVPEPTTDPGREEPSEVTRPFIEAFKLGSQMGRRPPDSRESSPSETKY